MKFTTTVRDLHVNANIAAYVAAVRSTLPVLGNLLIQATADNQLRISGNRLEMGMAVYMHAKIETEGATTVPVKTFIDLLATLPGSAELTFTCKDDVSTIVTEFVDDKGKKSKSRNNIKGIPAMEFPLVNDHLDVESVQMELSEFRAVAQQVLDTAATDEARPILTGLQMTVRDGVLTLSGADGFRLGIRSTDVPGASNLTIVIPGAAIRVLLKKFPNEGTLTIGSNPAGNYVVFICDKIALVAQLIDGNYPDLSAVMPKKLSNKALVKTGDLRQALQTAQVVAREASKTVVLKMAEGDDSHILIKGTSAETGFSECVVPAKVKGNIEIALNVGYLLDFLAVAGTNEVTLKTTTPTAPMLLEPVLASDLKYVVMPMNLGR